MIKPTVHMNGTSRDELYEGYLVAHDAVAAAIDACRLTSPNGRDYYPQGADAIVGASNEHRERMQKLERVRAELEELCVALLSK